jgi:hypothetical protein
MRRFNYIKMNHSSASEENNPLIYIQKCYLATIQNLVPLADVVSISIFSNKTVNYC